MWPNEDCSEHTEVRANISTLEMKIAEFNLRVGYTPAGSIPVPATAIDGSINVNLGAIAMDFQIYKCVREQANGKKQCWMVGAKSVNQNLFKSKINFNANFGQITTSASFLSNTPMGALIRQMMVQGVVQLYQDPSYNELPWKAVIEEIDVQNGYVFFSKGIEDRVATAQTFTVFSQVKGAGACSYWRPLANILTTDVYTVSSRARIDQLLDSAHPVQQGDIVMIRSVTPR
jgi:hypothetical protein